MPASDRPNRDPLTGEDFEAEQEALVAAHFAEQEARAKCDRLRRELDHAAGERDRANLEVSSAESALRMKIKRAVAHDD